MEIYGPNGSEIYGPSRDKHLLRKLMWIKKAWLSDRLELLIINSELVRGFLSAIFYHWFGNFQMWILGFGITFCSKLIFKYRISYAVKKSYNMVHIIWDSAFYRPRKNSILSRKDTKYGPYNNFQGWLSRFCTWTFSNVN